MPEGQFSRARSPVNLDPSRDGCRMCLEKEAALMQAFWAQILDSSPLSKVSQWEANEKRGSKKRERGMGRSMMVIDQLEISDK